MGQVYLKKPAKAEELDKKPTAPADNGVISYGFTLNYLKGVVLSKGKVKDRKNDIIVAITNALLEIDHVADMSEITGIYIQPCVYMRPNDKWPDGTVMYTAIDIVSQYPKASPSATTSKRLLWEGDYGKLINYLDVLSDATRTQEYVDSCSLGFNPYYPPVRITDCDFLFDNSISTHPSIYGAVRQIDVDFPTYPSLYKAEEDLLLRCKHSILFKTYTAEDDAPYLELKTYVLDRTTK